LNTFNKGQSDDWNFAFKGSELELFVDCLQLSGISFFNVVEHVREKFTEEVQEFEIVLFDGHFNVETNELAHVSMSE